MVKGGCQHDCPDTCAWEVSVEHGVAVRLTASATHPYTQGSLCAKVNHYLDKVYSVDRLRVPLRRTGPKGSAAFEEVSWDTALAAIARLTHAAVERYGSTTVMPYSHQGSMGVVQERSLDRRFFARLGASGLSRDLCGYTGDAGVTATYGPGTGVLPEQIEASRFIVFWGTNPVVTNVHLWSLALKAKRAGARIVVIDPLKTRSAAAADWHVQPFPGTDAALALGIMHVIIEEDLYDREYVRDFTIGFDQLKERAAEYPPARTSTITGLEESEIVALSRAYAHVRPALIRVVLGLEKHRHGGMTFRAISCLPVLVGAWRQTGGGLMHLTNRLHAQALNLDRLRMPELEDPSLRSFHMIDLGRALTDERLDPPVSVLIVYNANPATTSPNQSLVLRGLARTDLMTVVHDTFLTDTARYADYVLPATTNIEHWDLLRSWGQTYVTLNQPAIEPLGQAVSNTEFFRRLARAMGLTESCHYDSDEALIAQALSSDHPYLAGITLESLRAQGWQPLRLAADWRPYEKGGFKTPSGKCEFYSEALAAAGIDPLPTFEPLPPSPFPLHFIAGKSPVHFFNSGYANLPRHQAAEREPLLDIAPQDALERCISDGQQVRVWNAQGEIQIRARVGDRVRTGVVAAPHGWWPSRHASAAVNRLTSDGLGDLAGGADFYDTRVDVQPSL